MDKDVCGAVDGMSGREYRYARRKLAPSASTNPIWPDPGSNPGSGGEKPASKRLSYSTAKDVLLQEPIPSR
jgi:hypothetical protein